MLIANQVFSEYLGTFVEFWQNILKIKAIIKISTNEIFVGILKFNTCLYATAIQHFL